MVVIIQKIWLAMYVWMNIMFECKECVVKNMREREVLRDGVYVCVFES
jgi:protein-S-isoprenylcysteine O-methyltransferase Ste14